ETSAHEPEVHDASDDRHTPDRPAKAQDRLVQTGLLARGTQSFRVRALVHEPQRVFHGRRRGQERDGPRIKELLDPFPRRQGPVPPASWADMQITAEALAVDDITAAMTSNPEALFCHASPFRAPSCTMSRLCDSQFGAGSSRDRSQIEDC